MVPIWGAPPSGFDLLGRAVYFAFRASVGRAEKLSLGLLEDRLVRRWREGLAGLEEDG